MPITSPEWISIEHGANTLAGRSKPIPRVTKSFVLAAKTGGGVLPLNLMTDQFMNAFVLPVATRARMLVIRKSAGAVNQYPRVAPENVEFWGGMVAVWALAAPAINT